MPYWALDRNAQYMVVRAKAMATPAMVMPTMSSTSMERLSMRGARVIASCACRFKIFTLQSGCVTVTH